MITRSCVLLGTSTLAIPTAEVLLKLFPPLSTGGGARGGGFIGIITKPDEPVGRAHMVTPPPLAVWAKEHGVQYWQPETKEALTALLREFNPDIAIVAAYGKIIPPDALKIPRFGFVNIHPSLLPRYRGPSPIQAAIANGDAETGVTLMLLDAQVDHGPTIAQERVPLSPTATRSSLERELASLGASLLERTLPDYLASRITPQPQDHTHATTTPLLSRDHGRIDWREPSAVIEQKIRAYEDWPGTWCELPNGKRLKVLRAEVDGSTTEPPGIIAPPRHRFNVACGDHRLLTLITVQPEGKPTMNGNAFRLGHQRIEALK